MPREQSSSEIGDAEWIDVSVSLYDGMVDWPGNPPVSIRRFHDIERGDSHTLTELSMSAHVGTHIDAPLHFFREGAGIDDMPLDKVIGPARVIEIQDPVSIKPAELEPWSIREGERILFKTRNTPRVWQTGAFVEDFVYISDEAARFLVRKQIALAGVDYLSVGPAEGGSTVHRALLGGGIWIIEGLNLTGVRAGVYNLLCLPLKLKDSDGAPARAVLRPLSRQGETGAVV
ncbi:MAG: cyclase family protein [Dehalococcoidia bacterium]|nr:cyclase family protein [Dehalococcoidia bacterium]